METYVELRKRAKTKRDAILKAAQADYRKAIWRITELQRQLGDTKRVRKTTRGETTLVSLIKQHTPTDRTFTIVEVLASMRKAVGKRKINQATVRSQFCRLENIGQVRRIGWVDGNMVWAAAGLKMPEPAGGADPLPRIAHEVLCDAGRPMSIQEMLVAIREKGFRPNDTAKRFAANLRAGLYRNKKMFKRADGGKWAATVGSDAL